MNLSSTRPFRKVLIANRGEIAVRVARALRELHIGSVAIYSEPDRTALHVLYAVEAYAVGPGPARESYLDIERVVATAKKAGVDAIHPGYGFLAENADFAEACARADLTFIGPPPEAMRAMGDKLRARALMRDAGVPAVPGTDGPVAGLAECTREAERLGYPVLLKAAAGGGGKGMRVVRAPAELEGAIEMCKGEAGSAFGDATVYLEKYLTSPRHVEVQLLADAHGGIIHLGERDCSIQRRHQKVIEECPSPVVTEDLRRRLCEIAIRAARAVGYQGAGTVEFLLEPSGQFYFLEMNTRLQVEHPITELVTGLDLVTLQIQVAEGMPLPLRQEEVRLRGAALECRIYAEDPESGFLPSPGVITGLRTPGGPGIRDDSGVYEGYEVPVHYDPLLSKLCAYGLDRTVAIRRMRRALAEYRVTGIKTNLAFHERILRSREFQQGAYDTSFLDTVFMRADSSRIRPNRDVALVAAALHAGALARKEARGALSDGASPREDGWRRSAILMGLRSRQSLLRS